MKKLVFTFSAIALFLTANAQDKKTETWPNSNKKSEGIIIGTPVDATASKAVQQRQGVNATKDGKWEYWFENGTVRSEEYYNKGTMIGNWKAWYDNGQLESDINFTTGKTTHYYKNGKTHSEGNVTKGGIPTGKWIAYHDNGQKNYEGAYGANGQKDGVWTWYDEKGKQTTVQTYKEGEQIK